MWKDHVAMREDKVSERENEIKNKKLNHAMRLRRRRGIGRASTQR